MSSTDTDQRSPWTRPGFIASAGVVALVAILGVTFGVGALRDDDDAPPAADPTAPSASSTASAAPSTAPAADEGGASVCGLEGVEMSGTVIAPPEASWTLIGTSAAPSSPTAGPGVIDDETGARYCYQHTPTGALFAAANLVALGDNDRVAEALAEHSLSEIGDGREAYLARVADPSTRDSNVRIQTAGFNVLAYDGETATIDVAIQTSRDAVGAVAIELVWEDGDWKAVMGDNGATVNAPVQLPDLTGYVPWAGV